MIRRPPRSTRTDTLSLHDALPISSAMTASIAPVSDVCRRPRSSTIVAGSSPVSSITSNTRSEEHTSELQSLMRTSYAVFCLKKKKTEHNYIYSHRDNNYKIPHYLTQVAITPTS